MAATEMHNSQAVTSSGKPVWQSRIVGHERVDPASLVANPHNFRTHPQAQREALSQAIEQLGFLRSVTVNMRTGNLVDGHERVWQALLTEQPLIDVEYVDLSEAEEKAALATMDPISEMASVDAAKLDELLRDVSVNGEALQQMLADLAEDAGLNSEPQGQEECEVPELFQVAVECRDEDDQKTMFDRMTKEGRKCRVLTL